MNRHAPIAPDRDYDPGAADAERQLWGAVIWRAVSDAVWPGVGAEARFHRDQAREWFRFGGKDFRLVCELAGFDPDFIRDRVLPMIDNPPPKLTKEMISEARRAK